MNRDSVGVVLLAVAMAALLAPLALPTAANAQEKKPVPPMEEWTQDVRKRIAKDDKLKALAEKYPLVLLHSRRLYAHGGYKQSAFSFIHESSDSDKHQNNVQLLWGNGGSKDRITTNAFVIHQNLIADLGKGDLEKNPDLERVAIDHPGLGTYVQAKDGHVYLERVRDGLGSNFYVLFQVVAVDPDGRYVAFLWRKAPGGRPGQRQGDPLNADKQNRPVEILPASTLKEWEQDVRKQIAKDDKLKALATKYPLVLLHSHELYEGNQTSFSFRYGSFKREENRGFFDFGFPGGPAGSRLQANMLGGQQNLIADLGKQDFEKNPDLAAVAIDHPALAHQGYAAEGNVHLQRIRDIDGTNFYVVFQIVTVDPDGRFIALLWRRLPGGKIVKFK